MPDPIHLLIDGKPAEVPRGVTVAVAILMKGESGLRPICGMGVCFGCRVAIDGTPHQRSCQTVCREGMVVSTS